MADAWRELNGVLIGAALFLLFAGLLFQHQIIIKLNDTIRTQDEELSGYAMFMSDTFSLLVTEEEQEIIDSIMPLDDNKVELLVIAVPISVCGACFDSLLLSLQEIKVDVDKVWFFCADAGDQIRRKLKSRGYSNICSSEDINKLDEITLHRISNNGWKNLYLKYRDGYDTALNFFMAS